MDSLLNPSETYYGIPVESVEARAVELGWGYGVTLYNTSLATANSDTFLLRTGDANLITSNILSIHCVDVANNKDASVAVDFYEGATVTDVGVDTGVIVANYKRSSTETPTFTTKKAPTTTDDGTVLYKAILSSPEASNSGVTWQLKSNTDYLIRLSNSSGVTASYTLNMNIFQLPS